MTEFSPQAEPELGEHSPQSLAKRVTHGGVLTLAIDPANDTKTVDPIEAATGTPLTIVKGKFYRVISTVDIRLRFSIDGAGAAAATDTYLPANAPIVIRNRRWNRIQTLAVSSAGIVQVVEVL